MLWLDLANAYGSIPHKLVEVTLCKHHIPDKFTDLICNYYNHVKLRFTVNGFTTNWQRLEVGIVTGASQQRASSKRDGHCKSCLIKWARMKFKPVKSRSLVIKRGKVEDRFRFKIGNDIIPTVTEKPVKSLGKLFDKTLSDREAIQEMKQQLRGWMEIQWTKEGFRGSSRHGVTNMAYSLVCYGHYWFMQYLLQQWRCSRT